VELLGLRRLTTLLLGIERVDGTCETTQIMVTRTP